MLVSPFTLLGWYVRYPTNERIGSGKWAPW
jgi:hypothetical protein